MKRLHFLFFPLVITLLFFSFREVMPDDQKSLLWKISGKNLTSPSYIYGTIHAICPENITDTAHINKVFAQTEQLVLELDMDDPALMQQVQSLSINPNMENISSKLSEEDLKVVDAFLKANYGAGMKQFGVMKPFAILSMFALKSTSCVQPISFEQFFVQKATAQKREIKGLETAQKQLSLFDDVPVETQLQWIVDYAKDESLLKDNYARLLEAYQAKDVEKLYDIIAEDPQYQDMVDKILYHRNKAWIAPMLEMASEKSTFFAVGAGHLGSEKGVLELLKQEGYTVTPVK